MEKSLFQAFQKSQESDGLGLGLTIVERSLLALNAEITYISDKSEQSDLKGAHFLMKFPSL